MSTKLRIEMATQPSSAKNQVGPFVAGSTLSDLMGLAEIENIGLRLVNAQEQLRDPMRQRYQDLRGAAKEYFCEDDQSAALLLQKTGDSEYIPDFVQYVYCWLIEDRLGGLILSGVSTDVGNHEQIDLQESAFWDQSAEIAQALSNKYTQSPAALANYFNFTVFPGLPRAPGIDPQGVFSAFPRLVKSEDGHEPAASIATYYWGPAVLLPSDREIGAEVAASAAHTSEAARRICCNDHWIVVCSHSVERYVRTIESLHVYTKLIYISRQVMDEVGRKLIAQRGAQVEAEARAEIDRFKESRFKSEEEKQARISKLSQIL
jgi:hypothetical protein